MSITNPNQSPFQTMSPNPFGNPFGSIFQQMAGQMAPQTNVRGTPTNTQTQVPQYGYTNPSYAETWTTPTGLGYNPDYFRRRMHNAEGDWWDEYRYGSSDLPRQSSVDYAYAQTDQSLPFRDWLAQMIDQGYAYQNGGAYGMTPTYYVQDQGWIQDANGQLVNTTTSGLGHRMQADPVYDARIRMQYSGGGRYTNPTTGKTYVSSWATPTNPNTNTQMTPRYGYAGASGVSKPAPAAPPVAQPTPQPRPGSRTQNLPPPTYSGGMRR